MSKDATVATAVPSAYERLAAQFDIAAHKKVKKGGREQTYIPWTDKVERFNTVLGQDWSFRIIREGMTDTEAWVLGELSVTIDGVTTVRQQYGCESITRGQSASPVTDLFKIAGTDALSKAATLFGCGLYLSIQEERAEVEAAMQEAVRAAAQAQRENARPASAPKSTPSSGAGASSTAAGSNNAPRAAVSKERFDLEKAYFAGRAYAVKIGLDLEELEVATLSDTDLAEVVDALREQCRYVLAEQKKQKVS